MIEDLEITIKGELKKLDDSRNVSQQIPILQYFEESDPEVKSQMMMSQFSDGQYYPTTISLGFKPLIVKQISGVWLLISGHDPQAQIYSQATLRLVQTVDTGGRVCAAAGSKQYCFVATVDRTVLVFKLGSWDLLKTIKTMQAATCMDVMSDQILVYGLGDDGFGCVHFKEDFRQYEQQSPLEAGKKSIAKTDLRSNFNGDGFVSKCGGYTLADTKQTSNAKITQFKLQGGFNLQSQKHKNCHIIGEIEEDVWLVYSQNDHSFATWNSTSNQLVSVNLVQRKFGQETELVDGGEQIKFIALHPGAFKLQFPFLITVNQQDRIQIRRFDIAQGYSQQVQIAEQKPGLTLFDCNWTRKGVLQIFQVKKVAGLPYQKQRKYLSEDIPDTNHYEVVKSEYSDGVIQAFDII